MDRIGRLVRNRNELSFVQLKEQQSSLVERQVNLTSRITRVL